MDDYLDSAWSVIEAFLNKAVVVLNSLVSPLESFGPGVVIFILALSIVLITRCTNRFYTTKRFRTLKKDFEHWQSVREEAMKHPDREKGKALAKNIDQAKLNKAYYDYFFEGFLKNMITNVLPIILMAAYVTSVYTPQTLLTRFGSQWVFSISMGSSFQVNASSLLWYVVSLLLSFILWALVNAILKKKNAKKAAA